MAYNEEFLKKMVQCGTLGYPLSKIMNIFDVENERQFAKDFNDINSLIYKYYQKGMDLADFLIDGKLYEMAKDGDLKALEQYEMRKRMNLHRSKTEILDRDIDDDNNTEQ
jgi:hypothetical protein